VPGINLQSTRGLCLLASAVDDGPAARRQVKRQVVEEVQVEACELLFHIGSMGSVNVARVAVPGALRQCMIVKPTADR